MAVGISNLTENGISIYPNPTNGIITIDFTNVTNFGKVEIEITDISCKILLTTSNLQINIPYLQNGVYLLKIETETRVYIQKIIKQ